MRRASPLPQAPDGLPPEVARAWNELVRVVTQEFNTPNRLGTNYILVGTSAVSATVSINVTSPNLSATTEALAKLLKDLKKAGMLTVQES